jgi:signal transduction histidine kinase
MLTRRMVFLGVLRRLRSAGGPVRYLVAGLMLVAALALTTAVEPFMHRAPSAPLFAGILAVAWTVGFGPALMTTVLGVVALDYVGDVPPYRFHLADRDTAWILLFAVTVLGVAWMVSVLRRLEEEREQLLESERAARRDAEAAARARDEFLAIVSHELRSPLATILGWVGILRSGTGGAGQAARAIDTIERNTRLQAKLIDDLLDVSRIVAGKFGLEPRSIELAPIVRQAVDAFQPLADEAGVILVRRVDTGLRVLGDAARLHQVVSNLVSNALKFTPAGGRVDVELTRGPGGAHLSVRDTGSGIPREILPHVFERFRQGAAGAGRSEGLGLGLAIARHVVEQHGGSITADSAGRGCGATFVVLLPLEDDARRD